MMRHSFSGRSIMSMCFTPNSLSASTAADTMAGVEPSVPASPHPLAPSGLTGVVQVVGATVTDDIGRVINPMIVDGQIHGGLAQGIGQALWEEVVYDDEGQLITGSLMDYAVPRAEHFPWFETDRTETPSPLNPLGAKGIGELATIGSTPTIVHAVVDALSPFGIRHLDMPLRPQRVWEAIQGARQANEAAD